MAEPNAPVVCEKCDNVFSSAAVSKLANPQQCPSCGGNLVSQSVLRDREISKTRHSTWTAIFLTTEALYWGGFAVLCVFALLAAFGIK